MECLDAHLGQNQLYCTLVTSLLRALGSPSSRAAAHRTISRRIWQVDMLNTWLTTYLGGDSVL